MQVVANASAIESCKVQVVQNCKVARVQVAAKLVQVPVQVLIQIAIWILNLILSANFNYVYLQTLVSLLVYSTYWVNSRK